MDIEILMEKSFEIIERAHNDCNRRDTKLFVIDLPAAVICSFWLGARNKDYRCRTQSIVRSIFPKANNERCGSCRLDSVKLYCVVRARSYQ